MSAKGVGGTSHALMNSLTIKSLEQIKSRAMPALSILNFHRPERRKAESKRRTQMMTRGMVRKLIVLERMKNIASVPHIHLGSGLDKLPRPSIIFRRTSWYKAIANTRVINQMT